MTSLLISQIIGLIGLLFFSYFSWRKIVLGIYLIVFFLPFYLIKLNIFGIPATIPELAIYILFFIWLVKKHGQIKSPINFKNKFLKFGVFLILSGVTISTILSIDIKASAGILKGWFFAPILFFIILVATPKNQNQTENILKTFALSGLIVAILSLFYQTGYKTNGISYDGRLHGFYASPNYLAMYLAIPFIIVLWYFLKNTKKIIWPVLALIIATSIYFTYSYAAWLAIFTSVFLLIYLMMPAETIKKWFLIVFLFLFILFTSQSATEKFSNLRHLAYRSSANSRLMIWQAALTIGRDHPIFGIGPGNFQRYYLDYQIKFTEPYLEWAVPEPHNIFLAFWLETGIIGLAGFIIILIWFFQTGVFILKKHRSVDAQNIAIILLSIMTYILCHGVFDTTYWKNDLSIIFWLIIGLLTNLLFNYRAKIFNSAIQHIKN